MTLARIALTGITLCLVLFRATSSDAQPAQDIHADHDASHMAAVPGSLLQAVRTVSLPFLNPETARASGYEPFLGCVSGPQEGAMGVHYVNGPLVDGELDVNHPEAILYEVKNGRARLLGVEYIVIAEAWDANNPLPPALVGQVFNYNSTPNRFGLPAFYELHVWAWRDNPNGTFVDFNPQVSCDAFNPKP